MPLFEARPRDIRQLAQKSFETSRPATTLLYNLNVSSLYTAIALSATSVLEYLGSADPKLLGVTLAALAGSIAGFITTIEGDTLHEELKIGIRDRRLYKEFLEGFDIRDILVSDILQKVSSYSKEEFTNNALPMSGQTACIFRQLVAAKMLDHSVTLHQNMKKDTTKKDPTATIQHYLNTVEVPTMEEDIARQMRDDAKKTFDSLDPAVVDHEGNWTYDEINIGADQIGEIIGEQIEYAINYFAIAYNDVQPDSRISEFVFSRRIAAKKIEKFKHLEQRYVFPDLLSKVGNLELAFLQIANAHRDRLGNS